MFAAAKTYRSDFTKPIFALSLIQLEEASKPPKSELLSEKSLPSHQPPIDAEALKVEKKDLPPNGAFFTQAAISDCGAFVAVATSSKRIFVVEVERGVSSVVSRAICKSATRILFHPHNASQLLVAENSGDVFVFDVCTGAYTCILGHVSMVSDVVRPYLMRHFRFFNFNIAARCKCTACFCIGIFE